MKLIEFLKTESVKLLGDINRLEWKIKYVKDSPSPKHPFTYDLKIELKDWDNQLREYQELLNEIKEQITKLEKSE